MSDTSTPKRVIPDPGNWDYLYRRGAGWQVEIWRGDQLIFEKWYCLHADAVASIKRNGGAYDFIMKP